MEMSPWRLLYNYHLLIKTFKEKSLGKHWPINSDLYSDIAGRQMKIEKLQEGEDGSLV
jgi:hypothetical protein